MRDSAQYRASARTDARKRCDACRSQSPQKHAKFDDSKAAWFEKSSQPCVAHTHRFFQEIMHAHTRILVSRWLGVKCIQFCAMTKWNCEIAPLTKTSNLPGQYRSGNRVRNICQMSSIKIRSTKHHRINHTHTHAHMRRTHTRTCTHAKSTSPQEYTHAHTCCTDTTTPARKDPIMQ